MSGITESVVEEACLEWFRGLGYSTLYGPEIGPDGKAQERGGWSEVVLTGRLREAIVRINPDLPDPAVNAAVASVLRAESQNPLTENARVHKLLTEGVPVEYRDDAGEIRHALTWLIDFDGPNRNDWLVVNQFSVRKLGGKTR